MISTDRIHYLLRQYIANTASGAEVEELFDWLRKEGPGIEPVKELLQKMVSNTSPDASYDAAYWETVFQSVLDKAGITGEAPVRKIHGKWWWAAAAVIVFAIATTAIVVSDRKGGRDAEFVSGSNTDVSAPEINHATIKLADGNTVLLDSLNMGLLAQQGNVRLVKLADGQVAYQAAGGQVIREMQYNTLSNPRGSKVIDITLSDGSHVWLNSGSSVTYPVAFMGNERKVSINGEAYFEVAHDVQKPFYVINGNVEVRVLGTHFNVNAYDDEADVKITLLEGSVRVSRHGPQAVTLQPGQQGIVPVGTSADRQPKASGTGPDPGIEVRSNIDIDAVIAWKNGLFQFDRTPMNAVLKQLSRWYDVDVVFEKEAPDIKLLGEMKRDLTLNQVLRGLGEIGVNFRIEGKKLIVME